MNFIILGAGAIGCYVGGRLAIEPAAQRKGHRLSGPELRQAFL